MPTPLENLQAAVARHSQGDVAGAQALCRAVLQADPRNVDARHLLGVVHLQQGEAKVALKHLAEVARQRPDVPEVQYNLGLAYLAAERPKNALAAFDAALARAPDMADAWTGRARGLAMTGRHAEAIEAFDAALKIAPGNVVALNERGSSLAAAGRFLDAVVSWQTALQYAPADPGTLANIATIYVALNRHADALDFFRRALALAPNDETALVGSALALAGVMRHDEALSVYDRLIALRPRSAEYHYGRAHLFDLLGRKTEAAAGFERAAELDPTLWPAQIEVAVLRRIRCDWTAGKPLNLARARSDVAPAPPFSYVLLSDDPLIQLGNAHRFAATLGKPGLPPQVAFDGSRKIRLAYLSADYRTHPVAFLVAELIERHDRQRFDVVGISYGPNDESPIRRRLEAAFDQFHDARAWGDADIAQWLTANKIDIAIDLTGHCQGGRPGILTFRSAPVQVNYLGYPGTLGGALADYIIGDAVLTPPQHDGHFAEKVVRMPHTYQVTDTTRPMPCGEPSRAAAGLPESGFVFCCLNGPVKITPDVWAVWMRLLRRTDASVLWLLSDDQTVQANLRKAAHAGGIDPARLIFAPRVPNDQHLFRLRAADLFLDTLPYNAHTTASDALWAGVPLVTCGGRTFASRVCGSILHAAGLSDLATSSLADYEALAAALAADPAHLRALKERVDAARIASPMFDTARFTRNLETAYCTMLARAAGGHAPESFTVQER